MAGWELALPPPPLPSLSHPNSRSAHLTRLALAGAEMQTILDNPLASPFTLGVSSAASFGAALAMILGAGLPALPPSWLVPANAFLFAFGSVFLLQALASRRGAGPDRLAGDRPAGRRTCHRLSDRVRRTMAVDGLALRRTQGEELRRFRCTAALRRSSSGQPLGRARGRLRADDRLHRPGRSPPHIARLLLDEPTSALDPRHQIDVMEAVREIAQAEKIVVLAVLHDLNLALRWADLVVLLSDGAPGIGRASGKGGHDGSPGRVLSRRGPHRALFPRSPARPLRRQVR